MSACISCFPLSSTMFHCACKSMRFWPMFAAVTGAEKGAETLDMQLAHHDPRNFEMSQMLYILGTSQTLIRSGTDAAASSIIPSQALLYTIYRPELKKASTPSGRHITQPRCSFRLEHDSQCMQLAHYQQGPPEPFVRAQWQVPYHLYRALHH